MNDPKTPADEKPEIEEFPLSTREPGPDWPWRKGTSIDPETGYPTQRSLSGGAWTP